MNKDKSITIAFTGHRNDRITTDRQALSELLEQTIEKYYRRGLRHFLSGMAQGFDLLAAEVVLKARKRHPDIRLTAVVPCPEQTRYFSDEDKFTYKTVLNGCGRVVLIADRYTPDCFHRRNDYLTDNATLIVGYWDGMSKGGTYYTVRRAESKRLPVINLFADIRANEWWKQCPREVKAVFTGIDAGQASDAYYGTFWKRLDQADRNDMHRYWQYRRGELPLSEDEACDLLAAIVMALTDAELAEYETAPDLSDEQYDECFGKQSKTIEERIENGNFE